MQGLPPVGGEGLQDPDPAQRHHHCPGGGQSAAVLHELQGPSTEEAMGAYSSRTWTWTSSDEKLLDKLGADWGRPTPELLQAQTTAEEAKAKHADLPGGPPERDSYPARRLGLKVGVREGCEVVHTEVPPCRGRLKDPRLNGDSDLVGPRTEGRRDGLEHSGLKAGGSGVARPGAEGPDRQPTIPPASGSGATSSGAEGPDKPDTQDPEVQLAVLRWMMSKRVRDVCGPLGPTTGPSTRPGLGQQPHQGESGGAGEGHASQEPPGGWTPMGQVLR